CLGSGSLRSLGESPVQTSFTTAAFGAVAIAGITLLIIGPPQNRTDPVASTVPPPVATALTTPAPRARPAAAEPQWVVPDADALPDNDWGRTVRYGRDLITRTFALIGPEVADPSRRYAGNNLSCESCHLQAGTKQFGLPFQGVFADFPNYRARSGAVGTIEDRINGCMTRSMNGKRLPPDGPDMTAMVAYLKFLSEGRPVGAATPGRGSGAMPELIRAADPVRGKAVYAKICAACHGPAGQGQRVGAVGDAKGYTFPPLWGPDSFNDGAGMVRLISAANFVRSNMPNGTTWQTPALSVPDAWDVTAYVQSQPRPQRANLDRDFPKRLQRPVDSNYGPYVDAFSQEQHRLGPFAPIRAAIAEMKASATAKAPQPKPLSEGR
ncbi:MAG TPA: c-type cytochrome, partial [Acetobacteraceae bacterium]|nr:c-type cytochrome [Acetobacteraceae bacterium]